MKRLLFLPVLAALLWLAGCINGGRSSDTQFHMLTARAPAATAMLDTTVGVGPVRIAQFLARPPLVTHAGGSSLRVPDKQRWGEPLDQGIQRVLQQNLQALTGATVHSFPWRQRAVPEYAVRLEVQDLDRLDNGTAVLEATWLLEDLQRGALVRSQQERISVSVSGDYRNLADAYSELLAQLAQRIATVLNETVAAGEKQQAAQHLFQY